MEIKNKLALVTGASYGLGKTIAYHLLDEGAELILLARSEDKLREICEDMREKGGRAHYYTVDLMSLEQVKEVVERIKAELGTPDILVNNATMGHWNFVEESTYEDFDIHTTVAYLGTARMCVGFVNEMLEKPEASIVNITSAGDVARWSGATSYIVSKTAVTTFTDAFRLEMRGTNVNVMRFSAGKIGDTNYFKVHKDSEARIPGFAKLIPTITSEKAAKGIIRGIRKNKKEVIMPFMTKVTYFFYRLFPRTMTWIINSTGAGRKDIVKKTEAYVIA